MKIGNVDLAKDVLVIAEIGNNHEGSYARAEEMIGLAAETGVQAVKFQTLLPEQFVSRNETARLQRLRKFALSFDEFARLAKVAEGLGLMFLSTPLDLQSAAALNDFCPAFKISSGDNTFLPLIEQVASYKKPILLSTGLANLTDLERARSAVMHIWDELAHAGDLVLLHCVSAYPTPPGDANLAAIRTLASRFGGTVGYSDHTMGNDAALLSVALGARVIEKHFTLDKNFSDFRDHQLSANPQEMADLVRQIRVAAELLGNGEKTAQASEESNRTAIRRSIAAGRNLSEGTALRWEHLTWVRPGDGLAPGQEAKLLGRRLRRDVPQGELLRLEDCD